MRAWRNLRRLASVMWILLAGCAHQQTVTPAQSAELTKSSAECTILAVTVATTAPTCHDIKKGLAGLLKSSPECAEIFTGNSAFTVHCPGDAS